MNEKKASKSLTHERFRFYFTWFRLASVHIPNEDPPRMYTLYAVISFANTVWHLSAMIADLVIFRGDLEHFMETIRLVVPGIGSLYTVLYLRLKRKELEKMMYYTDIFSWDLIEKYDAKFPITWLLPRIQPLTLRIYCGTMLFHAAYCFVRILMSDARLLTVNASYGFDPSPSPVYEIINVLQYILGCWVILPFYGFPSLFFYFVAIACSQLEKLKEDLLTLQHNSQEQLNKCIQHHQHILEYMQNMERIINKELMGQFTLILGGMCCASFSCAMSWGNVLQMSQCVVAYLGFTVQLYAYCWIGNELTVHAESVRDAAWECNWVGASVPFQRSVMFVIAASTKEFALTAGKFVPVSRKTMMNLSRREINSISEAELTDVKENFLKRCQCCVDARGGISNISCNEVVNQTISYLMFLMQVKDKE